MSKVDPELLIENHRLRIRVRMLTTALLMISDQALRHIEVSTPEGRFGLAGEDEVEEVTASSDLNSVLLGFTNFISNEQVRAYNEGVDATIKRCTHWLTEEAKALRSQVSGGDGSEPQWIEAKTLDRAAIFLKEDISNTPKR